MILKSREKLSILLLEEIGKAERVILITLKSFLIIQGRILSILRC